MIHNKKFLFIEAILFLLIVGFSLNIGVQKTYADLSSLNIASGGWIDLATDGTGNGLVIAPSSGNLYQQTNLGFNPNSSSFNSVADSRPWVDVYGNSGSFYAVSNSNGDYIYRYDGTWSALNSGSNIPTGPFSAVAGSSGGQKIIAIVGGNSYAYTIDSGSNWVNVSSQGLNDVAMSGSGNYILIGTDEAVLRTADGPIAGFSVVSGLPATAWTDVAVSEDGQYQAAVAPGQAVYYSSDYGQTWGSVSGGNSWSGVDISNTGTLVASIAGGQLYIKYPNQTSWSLLHTNSAGWSSIKISGDGSRVFAAVDGGVVYYQDLDVTAPILSSGLPSGTLPAETTSVQLAVETNENATCKYDTVSGVYDSMSNVFDSTGNSAHYQTITGLGEGSYSYYVRCEDEFGNINTEDYTITFTIPAVDSTPPTITSVSSDKTNGTYTVGEVIDIDVTFSEAVTSTGNVTVTLETGTTDRTCTFSVSNSSSGTCNYTVQSGDTTSDLTVLSVSGTIEDQVSNAMVDFTPATNLAANKALVIDTTAPVTSSEAPSGTLPSNTPSVEITLNTDTDADCRYSTNEGSEYGVMSVFDTTGGTSHGTEITGLSSGTDYIYYIKCADDVGNIGNTQISFSVDSPEPSDSTPPTITSVSSDKTNGTYTVGEVIDIDVTFSEAVTSTGNVTVTLETGTTDRTCTFSVSNSSSGTCNYTVQSGDTTSDLTVLSVSGTIEDQVSNAMVDFTPATNLAANKALVIDTTAPSISSPLPGGDQAEGVTSVELSVTTDESATCKFGESVSANYGEMGNTFNTSLDGLTHTYTLSSLSAGSSYTYYVRCSDPASNVNTSSTEISFSIPSDTTSPTITNISSDKANGTYGPGEVIDIDITFSEIVALSEGAMYVGFNTGGACEVAEIPNTTSVSCDYTVGSGETSVSDLNVSSIYGTSGDIVDPSGNAMSNFTPATNLAANKEIVIDTAAPSVSSPLPSGAQSAGTTGVTLQVTTNENSTCKYGNIADTAYASISNTFSTTGGTTHTQSITGLSPNTTYAYYVRCSDSVSNVNTSDTTISFSIPADEEESSGGSGGMNVNLDASCSISDTTIKVGEEVDIDVDVEITKDGEDEDYTFKWTKVLTGTDQTTSTSFDTPGEYTPKAQIKSQYKDEVITCDTITVTGTSTKDESEEDENIIAKTTGTITATYETIITLYNQYIQTIQKDSTNINKLNDLINKIKEQFSLLEMTRLEQQSVFQFTKDLQFGMTDPEVKLLQQFLNAQGYLVEQTGPGSKGNETNNFGIATRAALIKFQQANNITPAIGYFGSVTRGVVNSLLN